MLNGLKDEKKFNFEKRKKKREKRRRECAGMRIN